MLGRHDVAVVGLGATGSAVAAALGARVWTVRGFDRFHPPHSRGSSHGKTRIIRESYWEDPSYVPMARRAFELWRRLERDEGSQILEVTGGLFMGPPDGELLQGILRAGAAHDIRLDRLGAGDIRARFPQFRAPPSFEGVLEPGAGFVRADAAIEALLQSARGAGATFQFDQPAAWGRDRDGLWIQTSDGRTRTSRIVLCAGAWMPELVGAPAPLAVERVTSHWFRPGSGDTRFGLGTCPLFAVEFETGRLVYGLPDEGDGLKAALHHGGRPSAPDQVDPVTPEDRTAVTALVRRFLPGLTAEPHASEVCLYTNTPDSHFLLDWHPADPDVFVASACSGHGFKFAPALGEAVAGALEGKTAPNPLFGFARFGRHDRPRP